MLFKSKPLLANFLLITATAFWGSTFIIIKKSLIGINAITLNFYRFAIAALVLGLIVFWQRKNPLHKYKHGLILGVILLGSYLLQTLGLYDISAADSGFITCLFVILVPIFSLISGREKFSVNLVIGVLLAGAGLWEITGGITEFERGEFVTLGGAAFFALYILYADRVVKRADVWILTFQQFFFMAIASLLVMILVRAPFTITTSLAFYGVFYLALFANVFAFLVQLNAQKTLTPAICAIILSMEPVFAAIFAWTIGGEKFVWHDIVGGLLIIASVIFAQVTETNKAKKTLL